MIYTAPPARGWDGGKISEIFLHRHLTVPQLQLPQQPQTNIIFKQKLLSFVMSVILAIVLEQSLFDQVQYAVSEVCQKFVWTMVTQRLEMFLSAWAMVPERLEMFLSGRWFQSS